MTSRRVPQFAAAASAALALAACGSSSSSSTSSTSSAPTTSTPATQSGAGPYSAGGGKAAPAARPTAGTVAVSADPTGALKFNVTTLHAQAGSVTLRMTDPASSGVAHGIAVQGNGVDKDSKVVQAGGTATVTATLKPGTYSFYCPVPGHEAAGMKGTLIVT
jgi:uncharacterized cupredoxin-like copper-binding protein